MSVASIRLMMVDPGTGMRLFASGEDLREWLSASESPTADDCTVLNDGTRIDSPPPRCGPLFVFLLVVAMVAACGSALVTESSVGRSLTFRPWFDAEIGDAPEEIRVAFYAPQATAGRCDEQHDVEVDETSEQVTVAVVVYWDENDDSSDCAESLLWVTAVLEEPLGDRVVTGIGSDFAMRLGADGLEVIPESTPCGRVDCSTPSSTRASCAAEDVRDAFDSIDGGILPAGGQHCDGSFLIVDMDVGSSGCISTGGSGENPCRNVKRAYFVERDTMWRVVTYGTDTVCADVLHLTGIAFPDDLCHSSGLEG